MKRSSPSTPQCQEDEIVDDWCGDEDCEYCDGDGGDPLNDYVLVCPECGGEG